MGSNTSETRIVAPILVVGEKEVDTALRPVHVPGTVSQSLHPADPVFETLEQAIEAVEVILP